MQSTDYKDKPWEKKQRVNHAYSQYLKDTKESGEEPLGLHAFDAAYYSHVQGQYFTQIEIDEAIAEIGNREQELVTRELNRDPLISEHDDGVSLSAEGVNTIVNTAVSQTNAPEDSAVQETLELLAAIPDPANPDEVLMPGMTDPDILAELSEEQNQEVLSTMTNRPGFTPYAPINPETRATVLQSVATTKGWSYKDMDVDNLIATFRDSRNKDVRETAAWALVQDYGWTRADFVQHGLPLTELQVDQLSDSQFEASSTLHGTPTKSPAEFAVKQATLQMRLRQAQNMPIGLEYATLADGKHGGMVSFNHKYGTNYASWDGLTRAFAQGSLSHGQQLTYMRLWDYAKSLDRSGKATNTTLTELQKIEQNTKDIRSGKAGQTDYNAMPSLLFGTMSTDVLRMALNNPEAAPETIQSFVKLSNFWKRDKSIWRDLALNHVQASLKAMGPGEAPSEAQISTMMQQALDPMTYIQNLQQGSHFFDRANLAWASFTGNVYGENYNKMVGKSEDSELKKRVKDAMAIIETSKTGEPSELISGAAHFLMGLYNGSSRSGDNDMVENLMMSAGMTPEGAYVTSLFLAHAQEAWGPSMAGDEVTSISDLLVVTERRWVGLWKAASFAAGANANDMSGVLTPAAAKGIQGMSHNNIWNVDDSDWRVFDGKDVDPDAQLKNTHMDELYRAFRDIELFTGSDVTADDMHERLWKGFEGIFTGLLSQEERDGWSDSKKLAYGFRTLLSDNELKDAFKGAMYAVAISNKTPGSTFKFGPADLATLMTVYLNREGRALIPIQMTDEGRMIPLVAAGGPNFTGNTWVRPDRGEDARELNGAAFNNLVRGSLKGSSVVEAKDRISKVLVRNFPTDMVGADQAAVLASIERVYQKEILNNTSGKAPTLVELHFRVAEDLVATGNNNTMLQLIANWGRKQTNANALGDLHVRANPVTNDIAGTVRGRRGAPQVQMVQSEKVVDTAGGFFMEFGSKDQENIIFTIPWWQIYDEDLIHPEQNLETELSNLGPIFATSFGPG